MNKEKEISSPFFIAGPCAVENFYMMDEIVRSLTQNGITMIRAGAFKPRTSPHHFQGLGIQGLEILAEIRKKYQVKIVSEILDVRHLDIMYKTIDILQVGARNMYSYELLKELGKIDSPVLLKRGLSATIDEFKYAAEYIRQGGNDKIMLCERGIRSFSQDTRNILDLSCVAILKKETEYPVVVDISHSLGRKDIAPEMTRAAIAIGADGIMVEVHNKPENAFSDKDQQMGIEEFTNYYRDLGY